MSIRIVKTTPGLTTTQQVIKMIRSYPEGVTAKEISQRLNRPISMIQICLKNLQSSRCIYSRTNKENRQLIYQALRAEVIPSPTVKRGNEAEQCE